MKKTIEENRFFGFILLEVLVSFSIASALVVLLFSMLSQVNRALLSIDDTIGAHQRAMIIFRQFERDIAGFFEPKYTKDDEKISHLFYGVNRDENMHLLTFLTHTVLDVSFLREDQDKGLVTQRDPYITRVTYRLEPEEVAYGGSQGQQSYTLRWIETKSLAFHQMETEDKGYELAQGIRSFSIRYLVPVVDNQEGDQSVHSVDVEKSPAYQTRKEWNLEDEEERGMIRQKAPDFIIIHLSLWGAKKNRLFQFTYQIPFSVDHEKQEIGKGSEGTE